jgi:hypothetical protein
VVHLAAVELVELVLVAAEQVDFDQQLLQLVVVVLLNLLYFYHLILLTQSLLVLVEHQLIRILKVTMEVTQYFLQ